MRSAREEEDEERESEDYGLIQIVARANRSQS